MCKSCVNRVNAPRVTNAFTVYVGVSRVCKSCEHNCKYPFDTPRVSNACTGYVGVNRVCKSCVNRVSTIASSAIKESSHNCKPCFTHDLHLHTHDLRVWNAFTLSLSCVRVTQLSVSTIASSAIKESSHDLHLHTPRVSNAFTLSLSCERDCK